MVKKKNKSLSQKILSKPKLKSKAISSSSLLKSFASGNRKLVRDEVDIEKQIEAERIRWI